MYKKTQVQHDRIKRIGSAGPTPRAAIAATNFSESKSRAISDPERISLQELRDRKIRLVADLASSPVGGRKVIEYQLASINRKIKAENHQILSCDDGNILRRAMREVLSDEDLRKVLQRKDQIERFALEKGYLPEKGISL